MLERRRAEEAGRAEAAVALVPAPTSVFASAVHWRHLRRCCRRRRRRHRRRRRCCRRRGCRRRRRCCRPLERTACSSPAPVLPPLGCPGSRQRSAPHAPIGRDNCGCGASGSERSSDHEACPSPPCRSGRKRTSGGDGSPQRLRPAAEAPGAHRSAAALGPGEQWRHHRRCCRRRQWRHHRRCCRRRLRRRRRLLPPPPPAPARTRRSRPCLTPPPPPPCQETAPNRGRRERASPRHAGASSRRRVGSCWTSFRKRQTGGRRN